VQPDVDVIVGDDAEDDIGAVGVGCGASALVDGDADNDAAPCCAADAVALPYSLVGAGDADAQTRTLRLRQRLRELEATLDAPLIGDFECVNADDHSMSDSNYEVESDVGSGVRRSSGHVSSVLFAGLADASAEA
jgi:hypothetical protein